MINDFNDLKKIILREKEIVSEMKVLFSNLKSANAEERVVIERQLKDLRKTLSVSVRRFDHSLNKISLVKKISRPVTVEKEVVKTPVKKEEVELKFRGGSKDFELTEMEKLTLKRLKKSKKKEVKKKVRKPSSYLKLSNKVFLESSAKLIDKPFFRGMEREIIRSNIEVLPRTYLSMLLLTSALSFLVALLIMGFFLIFNFGVDFPFITFSQEDFGARFAKTFWLLFVIPISTFFVLYFYPGLERRTDEAKIDQELPFATINMSAISGSMIEPTKIFSILSSTGDYPNISKQFNKLLNQINLQGYSLVNSLRNSAFNSPSEKLSELLNGLATTITSGGDLPNFFDKRSESLMLEYRLEKEKYAKTAETFMDIYISVVIAAPMILMLLLIMMQISGIGLSLSAGAISLMMALGVATINFAFLVFLHIRGSTRG